MKPITRMWIPGLFIVLGLSGLAHAASQTLTWPTWRGQTPNGTAAECNPPISWSETENIKWKIKLPGEGSSTPVIWGNKLFVQTAVPIVGQSASAEASTESREKSGWVDDVYYAAKPTQVYRFLLMCIDRRTGEVLWERTAAEAMPHEGRHDTATFAPYSPVTDGKRVWASFGSRGLYCYDLDGTPVGNTDLIQMNIHMTFGEGSSPVLAGDAIIVVMDHSGDSKIAAYDKNTGALLWEKPRDERVDWSSPVAAKVGDRLEVITSGMNRIRSYDAKTGDLVWECSGQTENTIPSPLLGFGNVYCVSGFRGHAMQAIRLGREGDLSGTDAIQWEADQNTPYVSSPLLYDDKIYLVADLRATVSCYDALTGKAYFTGKRIRGMKAVYASLVGAGGHVYISDREGTTTVIEHSDQFRVVSTNKLDDILDASPAIVGDELYLRGAKFLYCISK